MNRVEIKNDAKAKIKGNLWNIIWPVLLISVIEGTLISLFAGNAFNSIDFSDLENIKIPTSYSAIMSVVSILAGIVMAGYTKYILNFARTGKFDSNDILNTVKEKWLNILIANILVSIIVGVCSILLVIPGIIMAFAYAVVTYLVIDTDTKGSDALSKSRQMMKGYKMDYFVFNLSFIGWYLLVPLTFGLILIWLYPYVTVAQALYYDRLKTLKGIK